MIHESVITCPHCATAKPETMPADACQFFYTCTGCGAILKPKPGDCCVFQSSFSSITSKRSPLQRNPRSGAGSARREHEPGRTTNQT